MLGANVKKYESLGAEKEFFLIITTMNINIIKLQNVASIHDALLNLKEMVKEMSPTFQAHDYGSAFT